MKIYELAKELKIESKELINIVLDLGIDAKNHLSVLDDNQVEMVKNKIKPTIINTVWKPDLNRMICLKNISQGKLIYKSKRQIGYTVEWVKKGDTNYIELGEFINLKNSDRRFVTEPWIRIIEDDEIEILKYANVYQYYKDILDVNNIADILKLDFEAFKKKFDKFPEGFKNAVVKQAAEMIKNGTLDSIRIKKYIEEQMNIDLEILINAENKIES